MASFAFSEHPVNLVQVQIREERRDHSSLRNPLLAVDFQDQLNQMQNLRVLNPPGDLLQQVVMPHVVEVPRQIHVQNFHVTPQKVPLHLPHGLMGRPPGPIPVGTFLKIGLEDRFQDQLQRPLHYPILYRRYPKNTHLAVTLWDFHPPVPLGLIGPRDQLCPDPLKKAL